MKKKSEVYQKLMEHIAFVCTQHNATVKFVRSDRGGEYLPMEAHNYFAKRGIKHELTVHDSPQQNGVTERTNRILVENACTMLFRARFPRAFWAEAIRFMAQSPISRTCTASVASSMFVSKMLASWMNRPNRLNS